MQNSGLCLLFKLVKVSGVGWKKKGLLMFPMLTVFYLELENLNLNINRIETLTGKNMTLSFYS